MMAELLRAQCPDATVIEQEEGTDG